MVSIQAQCSRNEVQYVAGQYIYSFVKYKRAMLIFVLTLCFVAEFLTVAALRSSGAPQLDARYVVVEVSPMNRYFGADWYANMSKANIAEVHKDQHFVVYAVP